MVNQMNQIEDRESKLAINRAVDLVVLSDPESPVAEAYRSLRSTVKFANVEPPVRSVAIADAGSNGQHAIAAANLAAAIAIGGDSVVLVDADLRAPSLHSYFGLQNNRGLCDWLATGDVARPLPLESTTIAGLSILPAGLAAGSSSALPADLLGRDSARELFAMLREQASFVVVNGPSLAEFGDLLAVAPRVDAVLLLIRSGKTKRAAAQQAKTSLERVGARILGVVLTDSGGRLGA